MRRWNDLDISKMRMRRKGFPLGVLFLAILCAYSESSEKKPPPIEARQLRWPIPDQIPLGLAHGEDGSLVVQTEKNLYDFSAKKFILNEGAAKISGFSVCGKEPVFLSGESLYVTENGKTEKLLEVPLQ